MKRHIVALVLCAAVLPVLAFAQGEPGWNKHSLGANFEISLPMGDFSDIAGTGYGGNIRYQMGYSATTVFTATAGYLAWTAKDLSANTSVQPAAFSLFLGGKQYLVEGFYGSLEAGLYFIDYTYEGVVVGALGNTSRFMLPIGIGYQKSGFEIGVRYMLFDPDFNAFSFTVGYNFAL